MRVCARVGHLCASACASAESWPRGTLGGSRGRSSSGLSWSRRSSFLWTVAPSPLPRFLLSHPCSLPLCPPFPSFCRHLLRDGVGGVSGAPVCSSALTASPRTPTSLCSELGGAGLQVRAELVGVGGGEHLLHTSELAAGLQVQADRLLLHQEGAGFLPGAFSVERGHFSTIWWGPLVLHAGVRSTDWIL